jgi:TolB-like protein
MSDVFISYARSTEVQAERIAAALRGLSYEVWRDDELPAHRAYADVIEERLKSAKAVVVIWSAEAAKSHWVRAEANTALEVGTLVQLTVDGVMPPMPFNQIQCADLKGWSGDLGATGWRKVVASIADLVGAAGSSQSRPYAVTAAAKPAEPLLAVLAFDNLSGDPEMAYFSDGVSEEIRETVARGADLKVIGRASSFQFRGADKAAAHVAAELGATHVLDGSVRRSGQRVRISTDLVQCANATTLWSERFDRELTDIFALQDEIAAAVAAALKIAFAPARAVGPIAPAVYDLYLRARNLGWGVDLDVLPKKIQALEQVTAAAPGLAAAWALLADARAWLLRSRRQGPAYAAMRADVVAAAETALRLDTESGVAYTALALLEPWAAFAEREALLGKALAAAPNDPDCLISMAVHCYNLGRFQDAFRYCAQAYEVDPLHLRAALWRPVLGLHAENDTAEEAHRRWEDFRARWPEEEVAGATEAPVQAIFGNWALVDETAASMRRRPLAPYAEEQLRSAQALRDPTPETQAQILEGLTEDLARTGTVQVRSLCFAYFVGLKEETFALVEQASFAHLFDRDGPPPSGPAQPGSMFVISPRFDTATDIRFMRLCAKMGFCDYWVQTGRWPDCVDSVPYDFRAEARRLAGATA